MPQIATTSQAAGRDDRSSVWHTRVVPSAVGLEGFAWRVAWFVVIVKILFL
jgi:hypothetical protein